ncbi:DHH family phosphoesterase [Halobacterium salinarum]|uniref:DHH family phosphoesterase n=1 Tax=Halobacterium salinarum TaxID=2242 RepID=UPI001F4844BF|nr:DHHA1 domain-containing protein [Halobacterium salinarum]MCF2207910.1 DHH family phosphoesterase [Halobacterium salinarum]
MVSRLVLGCGTVGHAVIGSLADRRGELFVFDGDESRVDSLRNESVAAEVRDVTDPAAITLPDRSVDMVVVAGERADQNRLAAIAADAAHPDAGLVVYLGFDATPKDRHRIDSVADRVVDPGAELLSHANSLTESGASQRLQALRQTLQGIDGRLGVFMHDNPDPDAIAAAVGLQRIAEDAGVDSQACYFGEISHQENRAFVNLLEFDLRNVETQSDAEFDAVALVDHSGPGVNDQLAPDTDVDIVIDHHPPTTDVDAGFTDIRPDTGATSTILVEYLRGYGIDVRTAVATALLYGIRVDTDDFAREITPRDFTAAAWLLPNADTDVLERIEAPSLSADTFDTIAAGIRNRQLNGSVLASCVGQITARDTLAQTADRLLAMRGVAVTFVYGYFDGTIYVSARSRRKDLDLGAVLRSAFDDLGSAGGHADMAGAQLPLGLFDAVGEDAATTLTEMIEEVVASRFFEEVHGGTSGIQQGE